MYLPLSDLQWKALNQVFMKSASIVPARRRTGRPRRDDREVLDGVLYVLQAGCVWDAVPSEFTSSSTAQRRYREWVESGIWTEIWRVYWQTLLVAPSTEEQSKQFDRWDRAMANGKLVAVRVGTRVCVPSSSAD